MTAKEFRKRIKPYMLPIAIVFGMLFYKPLAQVQFIVPYLILLMLFITFCRVSPRDFKLDRMVWLLLVVQVFGSVAVFFALQPLDISLAQATMICVLCPTATAAPVVTGLLGGSIARVASYSIVCNITMAIFAPFFFVVANPQSHVDFFAASLGIASRLAPMIFAPLLAAFALRRFAPRVCTVVAQSQGASFYMWTVSLFIVVGKSVGFVMAEPASEIPIMTLMAVAAVLVCLAQFAIGRKIGTAYGDAISGAQGLGQKNTILAIWMANSYLNPLASIGPAAYILWQNIVNSYQLFRKSRSQG